MAPEKQMKRQREEDDEPEVFSSSKRKCSQPTTKKRPNFPKETIAVLNGWAWNHQKWPYPTAAKKKQFSVECKMTIRQVNQWFINFRRRTELPIEKIKKQQKKPQRQTPPPQEGSAAGSSSRVGGGPAYDDGIGLEESPGEEKEATGIECNYALRVLRNAISMNNILLEKTRSEIANAEAEVKRLDKIYLRVFGH